MGIFFSRICEKQYKWIKWRKQCEFLLQQKLIFISKAHAKRSAHLPDFVFTFFFCSIIQWYRMCKHVLFQLLFFGINPDIRTIKLTKQLDQDTNARERERIRYDRKKENVLDIYMRFSPFFAVFNISLSISYSANDWVSVAFWAGTTIEWNVHSKWNESHCA